MPGRGARPCAPTLSGRQRHIKTPPPHKAARRQPSPSGRGLGEGETPGAANPGIPPPHHHSRPNPPFPPPTVIPAKAGIHTPARCWSGTTGVLDSGLRRNDGEAPPGGAGTTGVLDSGLRRNDGGVGREWWGSWGWWLGAFLPHPTLSRWERAFVWHRWRGVDSRFRGNDEYVGGGSDEYVGGGNDGDGASEQFAIRNSQLIIDNC